MEEKPGPVTECPQNVEKPGFGLGMFRKWEKIWGSWVWNMLKNVENRVLGT
jgi:hypothetical protein